MSITENNYIYSLHDSGGEALLAGKGWVVITEDIGRDPYNTHGANYSAISAQGLTVISRLNNGYGSTGTIPMPPYYRDFAVRCGNFVQASQGCNIWIIGNEPNLEAEWPDGNPIFPGDYAACYKLCRNEIRKRPGHQQDLLLVAGPGPWNASVKYATNPTGDWVQYLQDQIWGVQSFDDIDGVALHTYTHGHEPQLIRSTETMAPPFQNRYYNFWAYKDFLNGLRAMNFMDKPIYITETNGNDKNWTGGNNGWVREAYKDINAWNEQNPKQVIRCLTLFRWGVDQLGYSIADRPAVQADFAEAVQKGYTWPDKITPPPPLQDEALAYARETATHLQAATASNRQTIDALTDADLIDDALTYALNTATHLTAATESNDKTLELLDEDGGDYEALQQARQTAAYLEAATTTNNNTIAALTAKTQLTIASVNQNDTTEITTMSEYIPSPMDWVAKQVELYEGSGGTAGLTLRDTGLPVIIVTNRGRKTGAIRKTPVMRVADGRNYILVASKGGAPEHPVWYYNLKADPNVEIRDKTKVYQMRVREVDDPVERQRLWTLAVEAFPPYRDYQTKTDRVIPVFVAEPVD